MTSINLAQFDSCTKAIQAFDDLLHSSDKLLVYTGYSGIGKSTMLNWLMQEKCNDIPSTYFSINGMEDLERDAFILKIMNHLRQFIDNNTYKTFDLRHEQISNLLYESRPADIDNEGDNVSIAVSTEFEKRKQLAWNELIFNFVNCLNSIQHQHIVIMIDTFERIPIISETKVLSQLLSISQSVPHLRIVIASQRVPKTLDSTVIFRLNNLTVDDSNQLLVSAGIHDETFQYDVYHKLAHGHPLITQLAVDMYKESKPNDLLDIPSVTDSEEAVDWLYYRIRDRIEDKLKPILKYIALPRKFTLETINTILPRDSERLTRDEFNALKRFSFIVSTQDNKSWTCLELMRKVVIEDFRNTEPATFKKSHQQAYSYFANNEDVVESIYHHFFFNEDEAFAQWRNRQRKVNAQQDYDELDRLFDVVLSTEIDLTKEQLAFVLLRQAHYMREIGQLQNATQIYSQCIELHRSLSLFDETYFHALHAHATTLQLLGDKHYDKARDILKGLHDLRPTDTYPLNTLANLEIQAGNIEEAWSILEQSLVLESRNQVTNSIKGHLAEQLEMWDIAQEAFSIIHNKRRKDTYIIQKLINIHLHQDNLEKAEQLLSYKRQIESEQADFENRLKSRIQEFQTWAQNGNEARCRKLLNEIMLYQPDFYQYLEDWAGGAERFKQYKAAEIYNKLYLEYVPDSHKVLYRYGKFKSRIRKNFGHARDLFLKCLDIDPNNAKVWFELGDAVRLQSKRRQSDTLLEDIKLSDSYFTQAFELWQTSDQYEDELGYDILKEHANLLRWVQGRGRHVFNRKIWSKIQDANLKTLLRVAKLMTTIEVTGQKAHNAVIRYAALEYKYGSLSVGDEYIQIALDEFGSDKQTIAILTREFSPNSSGNYRPRNLRLANDLLKDTKHNLIMLCVVARIEHSLKAEPKALSELKQKLQQFPTNETIISEIQGIEPSFKHTN